MLCERLHDDPEIDASEVTVNVQGGKITLEGTVDSRRTKNAIEDVAEQIGSQDVQNNLRVQKGRRAQRHGDEREVIDCHQVVHEHRGWRAVQAEAQLKRGAERA